MSINITKEIGAGYEAYLDQQIDADVTGTPILRRDTYPYVGGHTGIVDFAAGWQAALSAGQATEPVATNIAQVGEQVCHYTTCIRERCRAEERCLAVIAAGQVIPEPPTAFEVRVAGPDDVLPFGNELDAHRCANAINKTYLADCLRHPNEALVLCVATVHALGDQG